MDGDMWTTVEGSSNPLAQLEGRPLLGASLVVMLGPQNRYGARYFQTKLRDSAGRGSQPFLLALHQSGPYPSVNWIEVVRLDRTLVFPNQEIILSEEEMVRLFRYLSDLIPPGGHIMVEYDSAEWKETRLSISCGIPPVATPLGSMLFRIGCGVAFKDWWFAEGGSEGPRKLQGYKALDEDHRRARAADMAAELRSFLQRAEPSGGCHQVWESAQKRATEILSLLPTNETKYRES